MISFVCNMQLEYMGKTSGHNNNVFMSVVFRKCLPLLCSMQEAGSS